MASYSENKKTWMQSVKGFITDKLEDLGFLKNIALRSLVKRRKAEPVPPTEEKDIIMDPDPSTAKTENDVPNDVPTPTKIPQPMPVTSVSPVLDRAVENLEAALARQLAIEEMDKELDEILAPSAVDKSSPVDAEGLRQLIDDYCDPGNKGNNSKILAVVLDNAITATKDSKDKDILEGNDELIGQCIKKLDARYEKNQESRNIRNKLYAHYSLDAKIQLSEALADKRIAALDKVEEASPHHTSFATRLLKRVKNELSYFEKGIR